MGSFSNDYRQLRVRRLSFARFVELFIDWKFKGSVFQVELYTTQIQARSIAAQNCVIICTRNIFPQFVMLTIAEKFFACKLSRNFGQLCQEQLRKMSQLPVLWQKSIPVPGLNLSCIIPLEIKTLWTFRIYPTSSEVLKIIIHQLFAVLVDHSQYWSTIRRLFAALVDYSPTIRTIRWLFILFANYSYYLLTIRTIRLTILVLSIA